MSGVRKAEQAMTDAQVVVMAASSLVFAFHVGVYVGFSVHKRKRDKQMAGLIAERLLGKTELPPGANTQANANTGQMAGHGINSGPFMKLQNHMYANYLSQLQANKLSQPEANGLPKRSE